MKVHLRKRKQGKDGSISLYLEIYKGSITTDGKTKNLRDYEYLNLYLVDKPKNPIEKDSNKTSLELAESIRAKRQLEIKNGEYGFRNEFKQKTNFIEYFREQAEKKLVIEGDYGSWDSSVKHLINYAGTKVSFREVDENFCEGFKNYLATNIQKHSGKTLSSSSISSYFNKFRACLRLAVKDKIILSNPSTDVKNPKVVESIRNYLTIDELKELVKAECRYDVLKRAFIFGCLTGLRWSDIQKLIWKEVEKTNEGWRITFHQKKTKGLQYLDISEQARGFLGETKAPDERVFVGLKYSSCMNVELSKWMMRAKITKDITFHCSRHTFAVLALINDVDIFTVSKLLGHSNLKTTQVYAKIIDIKKREAVNKIPNINL